MQRKYQANITDPHIRHFQYLKRKKNISMVIAGTKDPMLDMNILTEHCINGGIKLELVENTDHSLETPDDISADIDILKRVVNLY